jgi:hypothetical protein
MNIYLQNFAREFMKDGLAKLPEKNHDIFRRMYSHKDLEKDINQIVDDLPEDKLDWAMMQIQRSVDKL